MNFRIQAAANLIKELNPTDVLDVGCRGCEASRALPPDIRYYGNDLFQNAEGSVDFVGDALCYEFGRTFQCVVALDIVEHVDDPYSLMDKLIGLADKYLIVSLPNIYDVLHKRDFLIGNTLGSKYEFGVENRMDRHRWLMSYDEIVEFYKYFAAKHCVQLEMHDVLIGSNSTRATSRALCSLGSLVFGRKNFTRTIVGLFSKQV